MNEIQNHQKLNEVGVGENAFLLVTVSAVAQQSSKPKLNLREMINNINKNQPNLEKQREEARKLKYVEEAKKLKNKIKADELAYAEVLETNHDLADAVYAEDINVLADYLKKRDDEAFKKEEEEHKRFIELSKDPFNPEYQRLVQ